MTRRFLTAEDVRRASGPEIVVDASTVVTPQALEAAREAGIVVRTAGGAWTEPPPDRGPDAERAQSTLPHLPEPDEDPSTGIAIVTAVGRNRPGVLAQITAAIAEAGGNVHDVSQRVVGGLFHMILTVDAGGAGSLHDLKTRLECLGRPDDFAVRVMNERVFRFMHRP